jgi:hypothetical protein
LVDTGQSTGGSIGIREGSSTSRPGGPAVQDDDVIGDDNQAADDGGQLGPAEQAEFHRTDIAGQVVTGRAEELCMGSPDAASTSRSGHAAGRAGSGHDAEMRGFGAWSGTSESGA